MNDRADLIARNAPRAYDLSDPREHSRLMREVRGYLHTCLGSHHGTDKSGRDYALDALDKIIEAQVPVKTANRTVP